MPALACGESSSISAAVSLTTRSPSLKDFTLLPARATRPQNSWPRTTGTFTGQDWVLWKWWMSLPQTPTASTCSRTSSSPMAGMGTSRSSTPPFLIS
jgi:hypothetical protein